MMPGGPTRLEDLQHCIYCDMMVDPASLGDVWWHFIHQGCILGGERNASLDGVKGEKVSGDA